MESKRFDLNKNVFLPDHSVCLGLNTAVTLPLRLNAFFEFASIQQSTPHPKLFYVGLTQ